MCVCMSSIVLLLTSLPSYMTSQWAMMVTRIFAFFQEWKVLKSGNVPTGSVTIHAPGIQFTRVVCVTLCSEAIPCQWHWEISVQSSLYYIVLHCSTPQNKAIVLAHYWVLQVSGYLFSCHFKECSAWREWSNCDQWSLLLCQRLLNSCWGAVVLAQQVSGYLSSCHFKDCSAWRECSNCGQWSLLLCRHLLNSCWGAVVLAHDWVYTTGEWVSFLMPF